MPPTSCNDECIPVGAISFESEQTGVTTRPSGVLYKDAQRRLVDETQAPAPDQFISFNLRVVLPENMDAADIRKRYNLRQATKEDTNSLFEVEKSAGSIFKSIPELADLADNHASSQQIQDWLDAGRIYLAEDDDNRPIGYTAAVPLDTALFIGEVSTVKEYQGKGVGSALIETVIWWARERAKLMGGKPRVSLTTYREVPWNAPWYRNRGFKEVDPEVIGVKHVDKMLYDPEERDLWRPGYTRCCMLWEED